MIATMSPGPDFAIVVKNSLVYSRKSAVLTALGIALGVLTHISYTLLGIGILITQNLWLFNIIKYLGATYLIYIGIKAILAKKTITIESNLSIKPELSVKSAIASGYFTCLLNPKAMLFLVSLFSVIISPATPKGILAIYCVMIFIVAFSWFSFVAVCFSNQKTRQKFSSVSHWIERITGCILLFIGINLFFVAF